MTPIKDKAMTIWLILTDASNQQTFTESLRTGWTLLLNLLQMLWLGLCALFVLLAWLLQHERAAKATYMAWYQQTASQGNLAAEFAKAVWGEVARIAIAVHSYARDYLDQYQGQHAEEPGAMVTASPIAAVAPAPVGSSPISIVRNPSATAAH